MDPQGHFPFPAGSFDRRLPQTIASYQHSSAGSSSCPPPSNISYRINDGAQKPHRSSGDVSFADFAQQAPLYPPPEPPILSRKSSSSPPSMDHVGASSFLRLPTSSRQRTLQACDKCRERKTKCSGDRPVCQRCSQRGLICCYAPLKESKPRGPTSRAHPSDSVPIGDYTDGGAYASSPSQSSQSIAEPVHTPRSASCDSSPQQRSQMHAPGRFYGMAPLLPRRTHGHVSCASAPSLPTTGLAQLFLEHGPTQSHSQPASAHPDVDPRQYRAGSFPTSTYAGLYDQHPYAAARQHMFESPPAVSYPDGNDLGSMALPLSAPNSGFGSSSGELLPQASGQTEMNALFYTDDASGHASMRAVDGAGYMSPAGSNHSSLSSPASASSSMAPPSSAYPDYSFQHAYAGAQDYGMQNSAMFEHGRTFNASPTTFNPQIDVVVHTMEAHSNFVADQHAAFVQQHQLQQARDRDNQMQMTRPQVDGHLDGHTMSDGFYSPFV